MTNGWVRVTLGHVDQSRNCKFLQGAEIAEPWISLQALDFRSNPSPFGNLPAVRLRRAISSGA
jgi:hypothetical protein